MRNTIGRRAGRRRLAVGVAMGLLGAVTVTGAATIGSVAGASGVSDHDWLAIVNAYRSQSGLSPVVEDAGYSAGAVNHSCWMLLNGIAHDEPAGTPGYTSSGDAAGNAGNVAVTSDPSATPRRHVDLWMSGPFHAIGVLRPGLQSSGFGICNSPPNPSSTPWKSAGTLDVIRGANWSAPAPASPVVFPGDGATTSLTRFIAESPDPRSFCGWTGQSVGLPLIALMPAGVSSASATLQGPGGPIDTCVLHGSNTSGVASSILGGSKAVVVVPAAPLQNGTHVVNVTSNGGNASWSFNVDPDAPLSPDVEPDPPDTPIVEPDPPETDIIGDAETLTTVAPFRFADSRHNQTIRRLPAQTKVRFRVAGTQGIPADASAISANFTIANTSSAGYLTAYECGGTVPQVSTVNYAAGDVVANQAIVTLAGNGDLCLFAHTATDVIIDVNGYTSPSGKAKLMPVQPTRILDTRNGSILRPGTPRVVDVVRRGSPVPSGATAVVVNLTAAGPRTFGWIRAFPCDVAEPDASTINVRAGRTRANSAIVPLADDGTICLRTTSTTDVLIDVTGWFGPAGAYDFTPLKPTRLADTRSQHALLNPRANGARLRTDQQLRVPVAGFRGVPSGAKTATLNVVAADAVGPGFLTILPCGTSGDVSTVNYLDAGAVANGITVKLGDQGSVCVTTSQTTDVIVDITGIWS